MVLGGRKEKCKVRHLVTMDPHDPAPVGVFLPVDPPRRLLARVSCLQRDLTWLIRTRPTVVAILLCYCGTTSVAVQQEGRSAHSGSKRPSRTEPEAVRVKLLGVYFVSVGFGTLKERARRPVRSPAPVQPRSGAEGFVTNLLYVAGLAPR